MHIGTSARSVELDTGPATENRLLAAVPPSERASLWRHLKRSIFRTGAVLYDLDQPVHRLYFPEGGLVSLVCIFEDGSTSEMAMVGKEGFVGVGATLGRHAAMGHYVAQTPVPALSIEVQQFRNALRQSETLRLVCAQFEHAMLAQALQAAACNNVHTVEERLARWLLMAHDRVGTPILHFKQELLAEMLSVRRSTVSVIAGMLQNAGLIRYRRGTIEILDRQGLEETSCECYRIISKRYDQLLPQVPASTVSSVPPVPARNDRLERSPALCSLPSSSMVDS